MKLKEEYLFDVLPVEKIFEKVIQEFGLNCSGPSITTPIG